MPPAAMLDVLMFVAVFGLLLTGYPVAFALGGAAFLFAILGHLFGVFDLGLLQALPQRIYGIMTNEVLIAIPLFVFMGVMLERSRVAEDLLDTAGRLFGRLPGGLGFAVTGVGALLAASTGIVGATAVTMGLISLPVMLRAGYDRRLACGSIAAAATLAQVVPPSTVLVVLGDQLAVAYQQAQLMEGNFAPATVTVGDLFAGALFPGLLLAALYLFYQAAVALLAPERSPALASAGGAAPPVHFGEVVRALVAPIALIVAVLGSILGGVATPTEAAAVGAIGAMLLAALRLVASGHGKRPAWFREVLRPALESTAQITTMIFVILIGATLFSLVFRGLGGDRTIHDALSSLPGGPAGAVLVVMMAMFVLGFFLDFLEIVFVVVPVVAPVLLRMEGIDPIWLGVLMAVNLQTSFLTPPFGPTLFYLRGIAPRAVATMDIYRGAMPFVALQIVGLVLLWFFPGLATWLPRALYG